MAITGIAFLTDMNSGELKGIVVSETAMRGEVNRYNEGGRMPKYKVDLAKGNNRTLRIFVEDENLDAYNVTGCVLVLTARKTKTASAVIIKSTAVAAQGAIGAANKGECFFYMLPADTATLSGQYLFEIKLTTQEAKVYTVLTGVLNLLG
jgi:hypothetical protein